MSAGAVRREGAGLKGLMNHAGKKIIRMREKIREHYWTYNGGGRQEKRAQVSNALLKVYLIFIKIKH